MSLGTIFMVVAAVLFILCTGGIATLGTLHLLPLGLFFMCLAHLGAGIRIGP